MSRPDPSQACLFSWGLSEPERLFPLLLSLGVLRTGPKETNVGELELPEQAGFPWSDRGMRGHMAAYFRSQMYGDSLSEPVVQYYVMGSVDETEAGGNEWREAEDWPIPVRPKTPCLKLLCV